jgi:tRNA wybutosine-synthesizing protein 1
MIVEQKQISLFKKQGYHFVGSLSAVKTCLWLRKSLRGEGECYKSRFYGISSHRCIQLTPTLRCNHRCIYCWRPIGVRFGKAEIDHPKKIVDGCIREQLSLLSGYKGSKKTDLRKLEEAKNPRHAAISLDGEPTLYPMLDELIKEFHKRAFTTFVVSNGSVPEVIREIAPTQFYISLSAPDEKTFKIVCNPVRNTWEKIRESLEIMKDMKCRKCIRVTLVKRLNMKNVEGYSRLIRIAEPDWIEVKAYMHLGYSQHRLPRSAMPSHEEVKDFSVALSEKIGCKIIDESEQSRVILLGSEENRLIS